MTVQTVCVPNAWSATTRDAPTPPLSSATPCGRTRHQRPRQVPQAGAGRSAWPTLSSPVNYILRPSSGRKLKQIVHVRRLKLAVDRASRPSALWTCHRTTLRMVAST
ncbi:MAG: hypothetical protein ACK4QW_19595 [Alphaproteobacteria bacterium]